MIRIYDLLKRLAAADLPILILGETGVGKENAAYAVHHGSARRARPFLTLNCAAIPETLVESELFGHEKGSFSGADKAHAGILERTAGGTLFLDEVGEFSLGVQAKLLRALEQKKVMRLGDTKERAVDARIVAATNRDLEAEVAAGRFRQDLYFRLCAATVVLPPLRERASEIPMLARAFLDEVCTAQGREPMELEPAALQALARHTWPGNVRELRNAMQYVAAATPSWTVDAADLPATIGRAQAPVGAGETPTADDLRERATPSSATISLPGAAGYHDAVGAAKRAILRSALQAEGGHQTRAARRLGLTQPYLARLIKTLRVNSED
jgi:DNA-binding NtrC family response regulator